MLTEKQAAAKATKLIMEDPAQLFFEQQTRVSSARLSAMLDTCAIHCVNNQLQQSLCTFEALVAIADALNEAAKEDEDLETILTQIRPLYDERGNFAFMVIQLWCMVVLGESSIEIMHVFDKAQFVELYTKYSNVGFHTGSNESGHYQCVVHSEDKSFGGGRAWQLNSTKEGPILRTTEKFLHNVTVTDCAHHAFDGIESDGVKPNMDEEVLRRLGGTASGRGGSTAWTQPVGSSWTRLRVPMATPTCWGHRRRQVQRLQRALSQCASETRPFAQGSSRDEPVPADHRLPRAVRGSAGWRASVCPPNSEPSTGMARQPCSGTTRATQQIRGRFLGAALPPLPLEAAAAAAPVASVRGKTHTKL